MYADFIQMVFNSEYVSDEINETHGTTVKTFTIIKAKSLLIPFPPLAEQHRIVAKVDRLMALCDELERQGVSCWIAPRNILPGTSWRASIVSAVESTHVMALIFSSNTQKSKQVIKELSIAVDTRGNIAVDPGTNRIADTNIFASGDAVSGASLVVRAMASGRKAAAAIDKYLHPHKS